MSARFNKNRRNQRIRSQVLLVLLFLFPLSFCLGDKIFKKDGTILEGKIILSNGEKYIIEVSPSLVKVQINAQDVERVEKTTEQDIPESFRAEYLQGEKALNEGDPLRAAELLLGVLNQTENPPKMLLHTLSKAFTQSLSMAQRNAGDPAVRSEAVKQYEKLFTLTELAAFKSFTKFQSQWQTLHADIQEKLALTYYLKAIDDTRQNDPKLYTRIEEYLTKALSLTPKTDSRYYQMVETLGVFKMNYQKSPDESLSIFKKAYEETTDSTLKDRFYQLMKQARDMKIVQPSSTPEPRITPTPYSTPRGTPIPRQTPPPAPPVITKEEIPWKEKLASNWKNKQYKKAAFILWGVILDSGVLPMIGAGLVVFFVFWIIPIIIMRWRTRRTDFLAGKFMILVKITGALGLAIYIFAAIFRFIFKKTAKGDICPYCKKRIDNIDAYIDYNFRICPHCHENIVPVYSLEDYILHLVENVQRTMKKRAGYKVDTNILEKDAMLKLIRGVITLAFRQRASDLHIEPEHEGLKIRARIDGMLYEILSLPKEISESVVSAIKVMSNLDISEKRIPQDGRISMWIDKRDLDLRISSSPVTQGEKVSMRILNPDDIMVDSVKLGLEGDNLEKFERAIRKPYGLILVTGPSGSGKSTTLYVALHSVNTGDKNIVTIEDPIEYKLEGISQQQVHVEANFTFATGLRSILRQDPDIIMVGEIRDKETAEIAIDAATTGHLVLTTLHTIDAPNAFGRLTDLGVPSRRFAPILIAIIAQRLVRLNCPECKKPYKPKTSSLEMLGIEENMGIVFMKGVECDQCNNTGFFGRTGIFEILMPDEEMKKILETNPSVSVIGALARKKGMKTLREEGILKISRGLTTVEEVLRVTM